MWMKIVPVIIRGYVMGTLYEEWLSAQGYRLTKWHLVQISVLKTVIDFYTLFENALYKSCEIVKCALTFPHQVPADIVSQMIFK